MQRSVAILGTRGYPSYYGGFETAVRHLAPALADEGWDVTVYGRTAESEAPTSEADPRVRRIVTRGIESRSLSTLSYGLTSALDAFRRKPDVALVMNVANGFWLPLLRARGIPTVVNVDGTEWLRAKWGPVARSVFHAGARFTAKSATTTVYDARAIQDLWRDKFGRDGVFIPYGGDPVDDVVPVETGLTAGEYVLVVARLVPENSIEEFVRAAPRIARSHDVVIVGSSRYGDELDRAVARLADENPRIHWLGSVADDRRLIGLWQNAGVYFHGHSVGGTNPALVQAMAVGVPTVARDTVFNREVLGDAGEFAPAEPEAIGDAILSLLGDDARRLELGAAARARATENYSWSDVCASYSRALAAAADGGR